MAGTIARFSIYSGSVLARVTLVREVEEAEATTINIRACRRSELGPLS